MVPGKVYLIGVLLIQASNEKQREVRLVIHLHSGLHMDGLVSLVVSNKVQQKLQHGIVSYTLVVGELSVQANFLGVGVHANGCAFAHMLAELLGHCADTKAWHMRQARCQCTSKQRQHAL